MEYRWRPGSAVYDSLYYLHTDPSGSIATVFKQDGSIAAKYSYDAWGRRRNYNDFTYTISTSDPLNQNLFDRFYTGHETIPLIGGASGGLINMNGRMYDPYVGRMLSPDNYVQSAGFTQSFNRYSYCINNPLKYTDPSGDFLVWLVPHIGFSGGGLDVGLTVGVGVPGILSAQATLGYDFGSKNAYGSVGGTLSGINASAGWGTQSGFNAGAGFGFGLGSGMGSNLTSAGISWSQNGGVSASALGFNYGRGGLNFGPSISYSHSVRFGRSPITQPAAYACKDCPADATMLPQVDIIGYRAKVNSGAASPGEIMAATLLLGAGTSEMPPVAIGVVVGGSIVAGATYLHNQFMGNPGDWHTTKPDPTGNMPFNNPPNGFNPENGPGGFWGPLVGGAFAAGYGYYRLKYEYNDHVNSLPQLPVLQTDKIYVAPKTPH